MKQGRLMQEIKKGDRILSKEEKRYISKAYQATQVFGIYVLNFFIVLFVIAIGLMFIFSLNDNSVSAEQFSKMLPILLLICVGLIVVFVKGVKVCGNKKAVRKGKYVVVEGVAEKYTPYKVPETISYVDAGGKDVSSGYSPIMDGKIIFRDNNGIKELGWIPLKYKSCPRGMNLGEFPVLLIKLSQEEKFAVTDWNKIRSNPEYAHIKPFMLF